MKNVVRLPKESVEPIAMLFGLSCWENIICLAAIQAQNGINRADLCKSGPDWGVTIQCHLLNVLADIVTSSIHLILTPVPTAVESIR
jgi:hypothetical protein